MSGCIHHWKIPTFPDLKTGLYKSRCKLCGKKREFIHVNIYPEKVKWGNQPIGGGDIMDTKIREIQCDYLRLSN